MIYSHSSYLIQMLAEHSRSQIINFQTRYPCIICFERLKTPVTCTRCRSLICVTHAKKIENKCPYCRLQPFEYVKEEYLQKLVELDRKKQEDFMIENSEFTCLVEGCNFRGKYHKMDLHRRKQHRHQSLREMIFPQQRENAKKLKAIRQLFSRFTSKQQDKCKYYGAALILQRKSNDKIQHSHLVQMLRHIDTCRHNDCVKVYVEPTMCLIGNSQKVISSCRESQQYLTFY